MTSKYLLMAEYETISGRTILSKTSFARSTEPDLPLKETVRENRVLYHHLLLSY